MVLHHPTYTQVDTFFLACVAGTRLNRTRVIFRPARASEVSHARKKWKELPLVRVFSLLVRVLLASYSRLTRRAPAIQASFHYLSD